MKIYSHRNGFTLIELSIVLVIIGLVVGGVLVGRDLMRAAELRAVVSDFDRFQTALYTFQSKYNCLAGDCAYTTRFFPTVLNGNGDGEYRPWPVESVAAVN